MKNEEEVTYIIESDEKQTHVVLTVSCASSFNGNDYLDCLQSFIDDFKNDPSSVFDNMMTATPDAVH